MYLVEDKRHGSTYLVFTWEDPRTAGYRGPVIEAASLDYDMKVHEWPNGSEHPDACPGRLKNDPRSYKVFKYRSQLKQQQEYEPVDGTLGVFLSWKDYVKIHLNPPEPDETADEQWYEYLDKVDETSRRRHSKLSDAPVNGSRDDVAAWVARKHFAVDSSIQKIWYLPQGAGTDEIRLLELSDRISDNISTIEAIDFGLEIEGASYRLMVADISSEKINEKTKEPVLLPVGWSLKGAKLWGRGT